MTLRKCTVTQLDDTFWRVDWEGPAAEAKTANCTLSARSPAVAERDGESWFFAGIWSQSLDDALSRFDLTRHNPAADPETAEEVLRANARIHPGYGDAHVVSGFTRDHAREILDVLDAVRADRDMHKTAANVYQERLRGAYQQISGLTKQSPADIEAVLAPVRECLTTLSNFAVVCAGDERAKSADLRYHDAGTSRANRMAFLESAARVSAALAEAEKIARGQ